jgi:hypothetical protein
MAGIGPAPKVASKRRRANKPRSYGAAQPTTAPAACPQDRVLGLEDPHPLIVSMWENIQKSCEATFYSEADWARLRLELWNANAVMASGKPISGNSWAVIQHGLNALLISPAEKRRVAIEVRPSGPDADENAAVAMIDRYRQKLKPV